MVTFTDVPLTSLHVSLTHYLLVIIYDDDSKTGIIAYNQLSVINPENSQKKVDSVWVWVTVTETS